MINFYPGPGKIYEQFAEDLSRGLETAVISCNHRSDTFEHLYQEVVKNMCDKLGLPAGYIVSFVSSATECWEIIAQSYNMSFIHIFNGAFGEKWKEVSLTHNKEIQAKKFALQDVPDTELNTGEAETMLCLTANETSNGTTLPEYYLKNLRLKYPGALIAVDATSSFGGVQHIYQAADIWFTSVQKCLGLPAGMGLLVLSPRAVQLASEEDLHYNSIKNIVKNAAKHQTTHTPNILNIYSLNEMLKRREHIQQVHKRLESQAEDWYQFIKTNTCFDLLVDRKEVASSTVLCISGDERLIENTLSKAKKNGFIMGKGYGPWKKQTFRIANFPSHTPNEISELKTFLEKV